MQCLTLKENFIFTAQIKLNIERRNLESSESIDSILLTTINALYIFKKTDQNKPDDFLENKLLLKYQHEEIYVEKFTNENNEIKYKPIDEDSDVKFSFKIEHPLAKEYIKILALFEGWKLAMKNAIENENEYKENLQFENENIDTKSAKKSNKGFVKELYPNQIYLFQIIDSFIQNNYVFQIDYLILDLYKEYQYFVEQFFYVITIFPKIEISNLILDEQLCNIFPRLFPNDTDSINKNIPNFNLKYSLIHLSLKSIYLKDSFAEKILPPLIMKSPFLQNLDLSNNFLTNKIFSTLIIKNFMNVHLKTLNLSYNQLSSDNLSKYIFQISKQFLRITLFDLRGNKIDNRFLNNFNPKVYEELRNIIQDKLSVNNVALNYQKETVTFDLRETNINLEKTSFRLFLKKKRDLSNHLEIKNNFNDNYETKFFGLETINFIFDIYFFKKNAYKYNYCSRSKTRLNIDIKNFKLKLPPSIDEKQIVKINPYNNWFYTEYYEKEVEQVDSKNEDKSVKSSDMNNNKKKNKNDENKKKKEEEKTKNRNDSNARKNKKLNSQKTNKGKGASAKKSLESSSKVTGNEPENIFPEPEKIIEEENSDSQSHHDDNNNIKKKKEKNEEKKLEEKEKEEEKKEEKEEKEEEKDNKEEKNDKEDKHSNDNSEEKSKGAEGQKEENKENEKENEKEIEKENNINNENNKENDNKELSPIKEENQKEKENEQEGEKEKLEINQDENKISQENNININPKKPNDNKYNDTIIITGTDDNSSEEEAHQIIPKISEISKPKIEKQKTQTAARKKNLKKSPVKARNTLLEKNVDLKKINAAKKYHELDLYRELFKFFFSKSSHNNSFIYFAHFNFFFNSIYAFRR